MSDSICRGDVVVVSLDPTVGSEVMKSRPCVVVQNDIGNKHGRTTIIVPITGAENIPRSFPVHVRIKTKEGGLSKESIALCDQIRAVDKQRIVEHLGRLASSTMQEIKTALKISLALD